MINTTTTPATQKQGKGIVYNNTNLGKWQLFGLGKSLFLVSYPLLVLWYNILEISCLANIFVMDLN